MQRKHTHTHKKKKDTETYAHLADKKLDKNDQNPIYFKADLFTEYTLNMINSNISF